MKNITRGLVSKLIEIDDLEKDRTVQTTWLSEAIYQYGEGVVNVNISNSLRGYLLGIKEQFTTYSLRVAVSLKSSYSIRMYELLMQYKVIGKRELTIKELRGYLGLKPEQYSKYSMFKKRTILRAQKEINSKTDIYFDFEEIKRGRKIHAIKFTIKKNESFGEVVKLPMGDTSGVALVDKLKQHGVKDQIAWQIVHAYLETDPDRITWHIEELESMLTSGKKVKSPAGYIVKAIDTDHRPQKSLWQEGLVEAEAKAKKMRQEKDEKAQTIQHLKSLISDHEREYRNYVGSEVDKWREGLSESDIEAISKRIEGELGTDWKVRDFRKNKWGSIFSSHHVDKYIRANITPLPYLEQDAYFKLKKKPTVLTLKKKLNKLTK